MSHPSLPEDMILDVLKLLPSRSLARFNCVSKQWQKYVSWVRSLPPQYMLGFFCQKPLTGEVTYLRAASVEFPWIFDNGDFDESINSLPNRIIDNTLAKTIYIVLCIVASSKGFLLCSPRPYFPQFYYIYNPSTRQLISLPEIENFDSNEAVGFICYDGGANQLSYRIVLTMYGDNHFFTRVVTFSSEDCKWLYFNLIFDVPLDQIFSLVRHQGIGVLMHDKDDDDKEDLRHVFYWMDFDRQHIVAVDVVKQTHWLIKLPPLLPPLDKQCTYFFLGVSGDDDGYLYLAIFDGVQLNLWSLKAVARGGGGGGGGGGNKEEEEWVLKYREEDFLNLAIHHITISDKYSHLRVSKSTRVIGIHPASPNLVYIDILSNIISFDFHSREFQILDVLPAYMYRSFMHECYYEWERLLPPLPAPTPPPIKPNRLMWPAS